VGPHCYGRVWEWCVCACTRPDLSAAGAPDLSKLCPRCFDAVRFGRGVCAELKAGRFRCEDRACRVHRAREVTEQQMQDEAQKFFEEHGV
jgi:hypothetical protein